MTTPPGIPRSVGVVFGVAAAVTASAISAFLLFLALGGHLGPGQDFPPAAISQTSLLGSWGDSGGIYSIQFRGDGSFTAPKWPADFPESGTAPQGDGSYSGSWKLSRDGKTVAITPTSSKGRPMNPLAETALAVVQVVKVHGSPELCVEADPDDPCDLGVLTRTR